MLIERRPSATTLGMDAKFESIKINELTFFAASEPEATVIEQSDSFSAKTSFTPSPVIATVCPLAFRALTRSNF